MPERGEGTRTTSSSASSSPTDSSDDISSLRYSSPPPSLTSMDSAQTFRLCLLKNNHLSQHTFSWTGFDHSAREWIFLPLSWAHLAWFKLFKPNQLHYLSIGWPCLGFLSTGELLPTGLASFTSFFSLRLPKGCIIRAIGKASNLHR